MRYFATAGGREYEITFRPVDGRLQATIAGRTCTVDVAAVGDGCAFSLLVDGRSHEVLVEPAGDGAVLVRIGAERLRVELADARERAAHSLAAHRPAGPRRLTAVMPGVVADVRVAAGEAVAAGQTLVVLEAMKMQNPIAADGAGTVKAVHVRKGQAVANGAVLVEIE